MKKVLVLVLVLGLATVSNAAISLTLDNSTATSAITIQVGQSVLVGINKNDSAGEGPFIDYELGADLGSKYTITGQVTPVGNLSGVQDLGISGTAQEYLVTVSSSTGLPANPGQVYNSTVTALAPYVLTVNLWDTTGSEIVDSASITMVPVPEPITMALLGLGGLFIRRRTA